MSKTQNGDSKGWNPNDKTFEEGQPHLKEAMKGVGLDPDAQLLTSKDPVAKKINKVLQTKNVPRGFKKWQLPFSLYNPSNAYITVGQPDAEVPNHSHIHGAGYRVVIEGSMNVLGPKGSEEPRVLTAGDWMYVPKGHPYSLKVGPRGVSLVASYEC